MKRVYLLLLLLCTVTASVAQTKQAELLLIGTFHFHNPGADLAKMKTFDVMAPKVQTELETITNKINQFAPDKIFVEWSSDDQAGLDELYMQYLGENYEEYIKTKYPNPKSRDFYLKNEIVQLAFRAGKKAKLTKIYALDYNKTSFPYDSVMKAMKEAQQETLIKGIESDLKAVETSFNKKVETSTLTQILLDFNTKEDLKANKAFYIDRLNRAGTTSNFAGPYLVSEWYRRNLYMYSLVQKSVQASDDKVMVLVGAGHAAMMKEFIELDHRFRIQELKTVLKSK
ncbi:DUF5694 domain-containing protein [Hymenobacter sp. YC55]|uniref:DUF5694 domain-containing protein n=1 Tax=Hymenobacter sp. YC55 TaxID=3034019 RepID=UPI0023F980E7|nr:DUF5694 domain-containing protein [Hymenobacter sp. YC55]MDF7814403.1 DUF5694 domain-containing protein [Hymenobacter sp. YC55]